MDYENPDSLVICEWCHKGLCLVTDFDWSIVGCGYQDSNGIKHFCSKNCLKEWLTFYGANEK